VLLPNVFQAIDRLHSYITSWLVLTDWRWCSFIFSMPDKRQISLVSNCWGFNFLFCSIIFAIKSSIS